MKVELFGDGVGSVEYVSHMGTDLSVVNAARVSFGAEKSALDERDVKLIGYLMRHNHTSPFEHCVITMRFTVPLFIRSQHHRHRTWSYNEISRRYTSVDMEFYEPAAFRKQHESNRQASTGELINPNLSGDDTVRLVPTASPILASGAVASHHKRSIKLYQQLLDSGISREQARGILPQNLYTQYYGTANLHNLLKFVSLRQHEGAQWEIQQVAKACLAIAVEHFPESVRAFKEKHMRKQ
jgi:thymidylate synthase (FAD)